MAYKRLTDLDEKAIVPSDAWVHIVDPSDTSQHPDGSSYKAKKSSITGTVSASDIATINHSASAKTTLVDADELTGQNSASSWALMRVTCLNVYNYIKTKTDMVYQVILTDVNFGAFINGLTGKTTPVDADSISIVDSADSNKQKKVTLTNFKTFLAGLFITKKAIVTNSSVTGTFTWDASVTDTYNLTMTGNTTFSIANFSSTYAEPMTVRMTGNYAVTYPSGSKVIGTYSGTLTNQLVIEKIGSDIFIIVNNYA